MIFWQNLRSASIQMDLHTLYLESVNAQNYRRGMTGA